MISTITTNGGILSNSGTLNQVFDAKDGSPAPISLAVAGDESFSSSTLNGTGGFLMLSSHGCSGPPIGITGSAFGNSSIEYFEDFVVQSATLPIGTPVSIQIKLGAARAFYALESDPSHPGGTAAVSGSATLHFDAATSTILTGAFGQQQIGSNPIFRSQSGIFASPFGPPDDVGDANAGEFTALVSGLVGSPFRITLQANVSAQSSAGNPYVTDADGQLSLVWGADVVGGLAEIRSPTDGSMFSTTSQAGADNALAILPPRPVPEPSTEGLALAGFLAIAAGAVRRGKQAH